VKILLYTAINAVWVIGTIILSGCSSKLAYKFTERATIGYTTAIHDDLISLPPPRERIVIAVYKFRDQTGQYKTSAQTTTFSTAVTQGATSMLNKALEDSGWFTPIEREGLPNLLNERQIIRSTRMQYMAEGGEKLSTLPPLLYAGVLLEGGIIGYDTNIITGGLGVMYFGLGGSGHVRKDQVTIYLRLVSTKNGQILKSVSVTKSILSRQVDFSIYRFVRIKRLLEAETGLSTNEPPSMCVLEAIEKAAFDLIIEGIQDGIWDLKNPKDIHSPIIQRYLEEEQQTEKIVTFDKKGKLIKVEDVKRPPALREPKLEQIEKPKLEEVEKHELEGAEKVEDVEKPEQIKTPEPKGKRPEPRKVEKSDTTAASIPPVITLNVVDGYDQKTETKLELNGKIHAVQAANDESWETGPGLYTSYDFSDIFIPVGVKVISIDIYVKHFEEGIFLPGKLEWAVGTGWPNNPVVWTSLYAPVYKGQQNKAVDVWNITSFVDTPEKINSLQLQVKNNSSITKTFVDYIYAVVQWK